MKANIIVSFDVIIGIPEVLSGSSGHYEQFHNQIWFNTYPSDDSH
jgi:hypothetical protein